MMHGMDPENFDFLALDKIIGVKGYKDHIAPLVPRRTCRQIIDSTRRAWHPNNYKGPYSEAEDNLLLRLKAEYGSNWMKIGEVLQRYHHNVKDRYKEIMSNYDKGPWSEDDDQRLIAIIKKIHGDEIPKNGILWSAVTATLKTRSRQQARSRWTRRLAVKRGNVLDAFGEVASLHWSREADLELIEQVIMQEPDNHTEIEWDRVAVENKGKRQIFTRFAELKKYVRGGNVLQFSELLDALATHLRWEVKTFAESIELVEELVDDRLQAIEEQVLAIESGEAVEQPPKKKNSKKAELAIYDQHEDDMDEDDIGQPKKKKKSKRSVSPALKRSKKEAQHDEQPPVQAVVVSKETEWPEGLRLKREVKKLLKAAGDLDSISQKQVRRQLEADWNIQISGDAKEHLKKVTAKLFAKISPSEAD
eukprot:TRINITY_DN5105_c0_g1_i3.p1 TRINITY_DN5105_c0_g1~~TRINITY_DN5105_c0_g1_i3.p1  ORF type:complete len:419 (+),score=87.30 TRINITY_DN5105_c0_g1_i3:204-1460(+)